MTLYRDSIIQAIIDALNESGPDELRTNYYHGDPVIMPQAQLPLCFVTKLSTQVRTHTTAEDSYESQIALNVVSSTTNDLSQGGDVLQAGTVTLYDLVEGREEDDDSKTSSIINVLRSKQVLNANKTYIQIGDSIDIEYVISPNSRRGLWSVEAIVRMVVTHNQVRSS